MDDYRPYLTINEDRALLGYPPLKGYGTVWEMSDDPAFMQWYTIEGEIYKPNGG